MTTPNPENPTTGETPDLSPLAQDLIKSEAPDGELYALLRELEETAQELRTELEARQGAREQLTDESLTDEAATAQTTAGAQPATPARPHRKVNPHVTPEQEEELKNFPEYWANSKGSWSNLFKLLRELRAEMREGKNNA